MSEAATFLGLIGSTAVGWASGASGERGVVELFVDGKRVDVAEATRPPPEAKEMAQLAPAGAAPSTLSAANDWFALKTPAELRTGKEMLFEVRRDGVLLGEGRFRLFGGLKGKFVGVKDGVAQGFVSNPFGEDPPPPLELRFDGKPLGQIVTEPPTPDGRHRFNAPLPPVRDGKIHEIEVFWAGSDAILPGSPQQWQAPRPGRRPLYQDLADKAPRRSRPDYALPPAELAAAASMLTGQGLRRHAPAAVSENASTIWRALGEARGGGPGINIILTASAFTDVETSFALGQLLSRRPAAAVRVLLPSPEAVAFAADDQRDLARDGLAPPMTANAFADLARRLPADEVVVFVPAHAALSKAFLDLVEAVIDEAAAGAAAPCGRAMATADSLLLATPATAGWISSRQSVGVLRGADLTDRVRTRRFEFEGVRFDDIELRVDKLGPAGAVIEIGASPRTTAAKTLIVVGDPASPPAAAVLTELRRLADTGLLVDAGAAPQGWTAIEGAGAIGEDRLRLAGALAARDGDAIVLEAVAGTALVDDLPAIRTLASGLGTAAIRRIARPRLDHMAQIEEALDLGCATEPTAVYIPVPGAQR